LNRAQDAVSSHSSLAARVKGVVETSDGAGRGDAVRVGGHSSLPIPLHAPTSSTWFDEFDRFASVGFAVADN